MSADSLSYEGREFEAAANLVNYYRWITDSFRPYLKGDGTEIGAGIGTYSGYLRQLLSTLDAVEPSTNQFKTLQEKFAEDKGVRAFSETIHDYLQRVGPDARDCICLVNVLEHIEHDADALSDLYRLIRPGGHVCIFVPAMPCLHSKLDDIFGHYRRYTKPELEEKVTGAGFTAMQSKYMDILGFPAWGLINTIMGSTNLNPALTSLYDRVFIPVTRTFEAVVPPPFGKSLLIVGQKRG